jgi:hypothetical protein
LEVAFVVCLLSVIFPRTASAEMPYRKVLETDKGWLIEISPTTSDFTSIANPLEGVGLAYKNATGKDLTWDVIVNTEENYRHDKAGRRMEPHYIPFCKKWDDGSDWKKTRDVSVLSKCHPERGDLIGIVPIPGPSDNLFIPMKPPLTDQQKQEVALKDAGCEGAKTFEDCLKIKTATVPAVDTTASAQIVELQSQNVSLVSAKTALTEENASLKTSNASLQANIASIPGRPSWLMFGLVVGLVGLVCTVGGTKLAKSGPDAEKRGKHGTARGLVRPGESQRVKDLEADLAKAEAENRKLSSRIAKLEAEKAKEPVQSVHDPETIIPADDKDFVLLYIATKPGTQERFDAIRRQCARERAVRAGAPADGKMAPQCEDLKVQLEKAIAAPKPDSQAELKIVVLENQLTASNAALEKMGARLEIAQGSIEKLTEDLDRSVEEMGGLRNAETKHESRRIGLEAEVSQLREANQELRKNQENAGSRRLRDIFKEYEEAKRRYEERLIPKLGVPDETSSQSGASADLESLRKASEAIVNEMFERIRLAFAVSPRDVEDFFSRAVQLQEKGRVQALTRHTKPASAGMLAHASSMSASNAGVVLASRGQADAEETSPVSALDDAVLSLRPGLLPAGIAEMAEHVGVDSKRLAAGNPMFPSSGGREATAEEKTREIPAEELEAQAAEDAARYGNVLVDPNSDLPVVAQKPLPANTTPDIPGVPPGYSPTPPPPSDAGHKRGRRKDPRRDD